VPFATLGAIQRVVIEVPRWSFVKRKLDGRIDLVSPLPCPYNYGSIVDITAPDGDPLDALVLGPRIARGEIARATVRGVMGFRDGGIDDPKVVCSTSALSVSERRGVERFFAVYAVFKRMLARVRGGSRDTACTGWLALE
jgi:inorganic pyrophosphatase